MQQHSSISRLFRAQRWHVQFWIIWTFWCQVTSINQTFPVHENFQLFSAVLVENWRHTMATCPVLSKTWQEVAAQRWHVGHFTFVLCKFLDLQSTEETSHDGGHMFVQWDAICVCNAFIITKIFISYTVV